MTPTPDQPQNELFKIIEPAMFNYPDQHYIDRALADLTRYIEQAEAVAELRGRVKEANLHEGRSIDRHEALRKELEATLRTRTEGEQDTQRNRKED